MVKIKSAYFRLKLSAFILRRGNEITISDASQRRVFHESIFSAMCTQ